MHTMQEHDGDLTVRDVMTPMPVSVATDSPVIEAARAMVRENVGSLPVVSGGDLVGIITDRDLVERVIARRLDPESVTVGECCTSEPVSAQPEESLDEALARMAQQQIRRLPVVEEGRLVGIVAQADVAHSAPPDATGEMVERISRDDQEG